MMAANRLPLLFGALILMHVLFPIWYWLEMRMRPAMRKIGILYSDAEFLNRTAISYHKMGVYVVPSLLTPLSAMRRAEAKLLERRMLIECVALVVIAVIPSGVLLFSSA